MPIANEIKTAPVILLNSRRFKSVQQAPGPFCKQRPRVIVFIGNLCSGGKERRLVEMLTYFREKNTYEFLLVMSRDEIHYKSFLKLDIPYVVLKKMTKHYDVSAFFQFYHICKEFQPQLIHTWGRIQTFYSLPAAVFKHIPLLNSQITSAPPKRFGFSANKLVDKINFRFSDIILSNSKAGIAAYNPPSGKAKVIYNGIDLNRFRYLPSPQEVKRRFNITTPFVVTMAASFTDHKDYELFFKVAVYVTAKRSDITFIGAGGCGAGDKQYKSLVGRSAGMGLIKFPGRINDVEALMNVSDLGVLFSNKLVHGEGISNAIIEFMTLGKPVIANDAGGTREIVFTSRNGYLIENETAEEIAALVMELINDREKCKRFGNESRRIIEEGFLLETMGEAFEETYNSLVNR